MISFNNALDEARKRISNWGSISKIQNVTLVRDARGRISVYLEPTTGTNLAESEIASLQYSLSASLGIFFQGNVYTEDPNTWTADLFALCELLIFPLSLFPMLLGTGLSGAFPKRHGLNVMVGKQLCGPMKPHNRQKRSLKLSPFFPIRVVWAEQPRWFL